MDRRVSGWLDNWLQKADRKPLVMRGARQVGKTWLVRDLARRSGRDLIEINFEHDPRIRRHFEANDPQRIVGELSLALGRDIRPEASLLFLDEVQAAPAVLAKLRWFAEEMPSLPVVAAGSLLDFALQDHASSMPVGRVTYCYVGPMTFPEYLQARGEQRLLEHLSAWAPAQELTTAAQERAHDLFSRYLMVGGMPAVVLADVAGEEARAVRRLQRDLVASFRDDFTKYVGRMDPHILDSVLFAVAGSIGRKLVYSRVGEGVKLHQAKRALELLARARLCHLVRHSAANSIPLGAEAKESDHKVLLLDIGLAHALLSTPAGVRHPSWEALAPAVRGQLVEQIVGQQLLAAIADDPCDETQLYYWRREGGRAGEVDFVVQLQQRILPIEIKAGAAGAMKSLHQFMFDKNLHTAIRLDANAPSLQQVAVTTTQGDPVRYRLLSLPHCMTWNVPGLIERLGGA